MSVVIVACEFCERKGDFFEEGFEQVVIRYEAGYDWTGELAFACKSCAKKFRNGELFVTKAGEELQPAEERAAVVLAWQYANDEPSTGEMWKKKYSEGTRWVKDSERVQREAEERRRLNALLLERTGMTLHQLKRKRFLEARYGSDPFLRFFAYLFGGRNYGE